MPALTIIHTTDLHGDPHGAIERAGRLLERIPGALWLDSGDALRCGNLTLGLSLERTLRRMAASGCAAMAMGNREFEPCVPCHRLKLMAAQFPVVCTNLVHPRPRSTPIVSEVRFACPGGRRVRVLGALRDMLPYRTAPLVSGYRFRDPLEALRPRCEGADPRDVVILLSHLGGTWDRRLLSMLPRLDLILGGHDHEGRCERSGRRAIVAPSPHGRQIAVITLRLGQPPAVRFTSSQWEEDDVVAEAAKDP